MAIVDCKDVSCIRTIAMNRARLACYLCCARWSVPYALRTVTPHIDSRLSNSYRWNLASSP